MQTTRTLSHQPLSHLTCLEDYILSIPVGDLPICPLQLRKFFEGPVGRWAGLQQICSRYRSQWYQDWFGASGRVSKWSLCNSLLFKKMVIDLVGRWTGLQQIDHQGVGFIVSLIGLGQWKSFRVVSQQYPPLPKNCKGPSGQMGRPPTDMLKIYASIQFR